MKDEDQIVKAYTSGKTPRSNETGGEVKVCTKIKCTRIVPDVLNFSRDDCDTQGNFKQ